MDIVSEWREIDQQSRALHFRLKFPSNYVGAITDYIVRDHRFIDSGAAFTARTIEPCYNEALRTPRIRTKQSHPRHNGMRNVTLN